MSAPDTASRDNTGWAPDLSLSDLSASRRPVERACYLIGAVLVISGLFHLGVFAFGDRSWYGPLSWRKPATFGLSFGITLISITWVSSYLRLAERTRAWILEGQDHGPADEVLVPVLKEFFA
jgi:hypothetical protein